MTRSHKAADDDGGTFRSQFSTAASQPSGSEFHSCVCSAEGKVSSVEARGAKVGRINQTRAARKKSPDPTHLHSVDGSFTGHRSATRGARRQERPTKTGALAAKSCRLKQTTS